MHYIYHIEGLVWLVCYLETMTITIGCVHHRSLSIDNVVRVSVAAAAAAGGDAVQ